MDSVKRFAAAAVLLFVGAAASAGEYSFGTGAEYTEGDYGTDSDTSALYVPLILGYDSDRFGWSLTVPYLSVTGTGEVVYSRTGVRQPVVDSSSTTAAPGGGSATTTTGNDERTVSGMGDVTLSATYRLLRGDIEEPTLAVTAKVKFATADENKGLGTGENDYALQVEAGIGRLYGYLGYLFIGDTATTDYDDIFYGAVGGSGPAGEWIAGAEVYAEQAVLDGADPVSELTVSAGRELGRDDWLKLYLIKGFSDSSADWGAGVGFTHYF